MKNREDVIEKMDIMMKELGLEEEMKMLTDIFSNSFMIQGDVTVDLKEALQRSPDDLLELIWDRIANQDTAEEIERSEKEEILYHAIQEDFEKNIIYLDRDRIKLLLQTACGEPISMMDTVVVNEDFVPCGWVFNFLKDGTCTFVVMDELRQIINHLRNKEMQVKGTYVICIRSAVNICLDLYGITAREQFDVICNKCFDRVDWEEHELPGKDAVEEALDAMEGQGLFWREDGYIISPDLHTKREYLVLLDDQGKKEYYMPDNDMIDAYIFNENLEKSPEYKEVHKLLTREIKDSDLAEEMLDEIAGYVAREEWSIPDVLDVMYDWEVELGDVKSANRIIAALSQWLYSIRRWSERGCSRKELGKENLDLKYVKADQGIRKNVTASKIYPNDPCPCGSGKKYKKCCGK